jgi:hypothetical protein
MCLESQRVRMGEVAKAAKALLFFCDDLEPEEQWSRAVDLLHKMDHVEKAMVWNLMTESEMSNVKLSRRRTAYKLALREVEERNASGAMFASMSLSSGAPSDPELEAKFSRLKQEHDELLGEYYRWSTVPENMRSNEEIPHMSGTHVGEFSQGTESISGMVSMVEAQLGVTQEIRNAIKDASNFRAALVDEINGKIAQTVKGELETLLQSLREEGSKKEDGAASKTQEEAFTAEMKTAIEQSVAAAGEKQRVALETRPSH